MLTARQEAFVQQFLLLGNASEAARVAGYSAKTARQMATENLSKPSIVAAIRELQAEYQAELQITKDDVLAGILSAIQMGREQRNPAVMIQGCVQLAKLLGFYEPEVHRVEVGDAANLKAKFAAMTDAELIALAYGPAS